MKYSFFKGGLVVEDKLYVVHMELGLLMEYDLVNLSYKVLAELESSKIKDDIWCVSSIIKLEDILFLCFENHEIIMSYDLKAKTLMEYGQEDNCNYWAITKVVNEDEMWRIPFSISQNMSVFDMRSGLFRKEESLEKYLQEAGCDLGGANEIRYIRQKEHIVYLTLVDSPYVLAFDLSRKSIDIYETLDVDKLFKVIYDGKYYWLTFSNKSKILRWDIENKELIKVESNEIQIGSNGREIAYIVEKYGRRYIIPTYSEMIICVDTENKVQQKECFKRTSKGGNASFIPPLFYKQNMIFLPLAADKMIWINTNTGDVSTRDVFLKEDDWIHYAIEKKRLRTSMIESEHFPLQDFLQIQFQSKGNIGAEK